MAFSYVLRKSCVKAKLLEQNIERQNAQMPMQHGYHMNLFFIDFRRFLVKYFRTLIFLSLSQYSQLLFHEFQFSIQILENVMYVT